MDKVESGFMPQLSAEKIWHNFEAQIDLAGVDWTLAFAQLAELYAHVDERNTINTSKLPLPCHAGCSACCYESVFLTRLEFLYAWAWYLKHFDDEVVIATVEQGLKLYHQNSDLIDKLNGPPPGGELDHFSIAQNLKFRCPFLSIEETCQIYPVRELYARLFGASFSEDSGIYGCHLVGQALADQTVTLLRVRQIALLLKKLPQTGLKQVYPYYLYNLYG